MKTLYDDLEQAIQKRERLKDGGFHLALIGITGGKKAQQRIVDGAVAAVEDINLLEDCGVCKHHDLDSCDLAGTKCHFEWRGPQAEKGEADGN